MRDNSVPAVVALAVVLSGIGLTAGPARAEITVRQAEYTAGVLVVTGETSRRNQRVTLDGRYTERSNRVGNFRFRVRYLPGDCSIELRAGRDVRTAQITNCSPRLPSPTASDTGGPDAAEARRGSGTGSAPRATESRDPPNAAPSPRGPVSGPAHLRVVRQRCDPGGLCLIVCRDGEYAVNAVCSTGRARLRGERAVTCSATTAGDITAYCMSIVDVGRR
ncbi:hypothetical protein [Rhodoplanes sp. SY1]|uniref:hypothetical protein n=1 Tax=Rhodoplanes sp. SY1 TaxID=3166646 RepID=UPI0038B43443